MRTIPASLLPTDPRFGSGPAKVRPDALAHLMHSAEVLGTSHRQAPVKDLVRDVQERLAALYKLPEGYQVVLGNGGSTLFWDLATFSLIEHRSAHGVFGEFSKKFAKAAAQTPFLADPLIAQAEPGGVAIPMAGEADTYCWAHNETSTGALAPIQRIGDGLVLIDGTSAAGGVALEVSQIDVYYFALQKNFSSDGGLWFALTSPAALERAQRIKADGRWIPAILDFATAADNSAKHQTLNTPAIATLLLAQAQLMWIEQLGGLTAAAARCQESSSALYDWADAHAHASPFVADPQYRSPVVATIDFDETIDAAALAATLRANGIVDIEPYRALKRNQIRVGCYVAVEPDDVRALIRCLEYLLDHATV